MARGQRSKVGDTRTSPNGYHYTRTEDRGWITTHTLTAEAHLGRRLHPNERIKFKDGNRQNFADPSNLIVYIVREGSKARRRARLEARIAELTAQLEELDESDEE